MQRNEGIFASWIKIISYAAEVYARNSEGSGMFQYVGDDPQSILEQIDHDIAEGKIAALTPPETGYIIEYKDVPGVHVFVNQKSADDKINGGKLVGTVFILSDREKGRRLLHRLSEAGYTAYMQCPEPQKCLVFADDYLPPATKDSDGFYIEDDALADRIRCELRREPYVRQNDCIFRFC